MMTPIAQRPGACLVRPSLPALSGVKTTAQESKDTNLTCYTYKLCTLFDKGCEEGLYLLCELVLFFLAEGKARVVEDNFPLKQEVGEVPQAQGEGAGKSV